MVGKLYHFDAIWDTGCLIFIDLPLGAGPEYCREKTIIKADAVLRTYLGKLKGDGKEIPIPKERKLTLDMISFPVNPDKIRPLTPYESYPENPYAEFAAGPDF